MSLGGLLLNLTMDIAMFVVEVVRLLLVASMLGISRVPVAVTRLAVARITIAIASPIVIEKLLWADAEDGTHAVRAVARSGPSAS